MILIFCAGLVASPVGLVSRLLEEKRPAYGVAGENGPRHAFSKPWVFIPDLVAKKEASTIAVAAPGDAVPEGEGDFPEYFGAIFGAGISLAGLAFSSLLTSFGFAGYYISVGYWPGLLTMGIAIGFLCSWSDHVRRDAIKGQQGEGCNGITRRC